MSYTEHEQQRLFAKGEDFLALAKTPQAAKGEDIAELIRVIRYHEWRYYVLDSPVLADAQYDALFKLLEYLEAQFPEARQADSPTTRVGSDLSADFATAAHLSPMLSLENSYNADDLRDFDKRVKKLLGAEETADIAYSVEPKFDGGTIVLRYVSDELALAATRGNGAAGEDISANARAIRTLPLSAKFSQYGIHTAELRGEVLLAKSQFEALNAQRLQKGEQQLANPRNAATGAIRLKSPTEVAARRLEVFVYQLAYAADKEGQEIPLASLFPTHGATIEALAGLGFKAPQEPQERRQCANIEAVMAFAADWATRRDEYGYEIDGLVIKVDSLDTQQQLGYTSHHPRWASAHKFAAKQATTRLEGIEFQVGRTGAVTPVAKLRTVELAGVQVSSVSLHNAELIAQKDIRIGDMVLVERAGDVIPQIVQALADLRTGAEQVVIFPTACPVCAAPLERGEEEAVWRCSAPNTCPAQQLQSFIHFASKDAMNIDGLGDSLIERFYQLGYLRQLDDLYKLDYDAIAKLERMGKRSVENLRRAIEGSKKNPAARLLYALGIRHIGRTNSRQLVQHIERLEDLAAWKTEDVLRLPDFGPKAAEQLVKAFANPETLPLLQRLAALGVNTQTLEEERAKEANPALPLSGKTILFTGTLPTLKRDAAEKMAETAGAKIASSVSKNLSYLVVGEEAGSKLEKAQKLGVATLSEAEFLSLIGG